MASRARQQAADGREFFERLCELRTTYRFRGPDDRADGRRPNSGAVAQATAIVEQADLCEAIVLPNEPSAHQDTDPKGGERHG